MYKYNTWFVRNDFTTYVKTGFLSGTLEARKII